MSQNNDTPNRIAMRVEDLSEDDMAAIMAAKVPAELAYDMAEIVDQPVMSRAPGETDEEFEAAKAAYRKLVWRRS